MWLGRSHGVAIAFLFLAGTCLATGSNVNKKHETADLGDAKHEINSFFNKFDDVITDQAVRLTEGEAKKDDVMNGQLLELVEVAEDLENEIYDESKREKHHQEDFDDDEDDEDEDEDEEEAEAMEKMQADAAALVDDTSRVLEEAEKKLHDNPNDEKLKNELSTLKSKASGVLGALKEVGAKRKLKKSLKKKNRKHRKGKKSRKWNKKGKKSTTITSEIQRDEAASGESPLWVNPLVGNPINSPLLKDRKEPESPYKIFPAHSNSQPLANFSDPRAWNSKPVDLNLPQDMNNKYQPQNRPISSKLGNSGYDDGLGRSNRQYYDTTGLKQYIDNCKDCVDAVNGYECPLNNEVLEMKKWASEVQQLLSFGCAKPESCQEPGVCCINDNWPFKQTVVQMTQMLKDVYNVFQERCKNGCKDKYQRDPAWSMWSSWSSCDKSCGRGLKERRRQCDNPAPSNGQQYCSGKSMQVDSCNMNECCVDGDWSSWGRWSTCSATCGQGFQERERQCNDPSPNSCGRSCDGPSSDLRECQGLASCCVDGDWSSWGKWSTCSATCGQGFMERQRLCNDPSPNSCGKTCDGRSSDIKECKGLASCCVDGDWSSWNKWSPCSATCGKGFMERKRSCDNPMANSCGRPCTGTGRDILACTSPNDCCVDGDWSSWSRWSPCSATCGKGVASRKRRCNSPSPNYCGDTCPGLPMEERQCGSQTDCCQDGNWNLWSSWSTCSKSCGSGLRSRIRRCDNPSPNFCGQRCPGNSFDALSCKENDCCVDGNWSPWNSWEGCSNTCGRGNELRRRACDSPAANFCGEPCNGAPVDLRTCNRGDCCVDGNWASWTSWSSCSATCGAGNQYRSRQCSDPPANSCGRSCPGAGSETKNCSTGLCELKCRDGNWSVWSSWTTCSESCGNGMRGRVRTCTNPSPSFCGVTCPGDGEDYEQCDRSRYAALAVDGEWGTWERWSTCSRSCGSGTRERRRACDRPSAGACGTPCRGLAYETDDCNTESCFQNCVDGNWGSWQGWSDCSEDCGEGYKFRRRLCDSPSANSCGRECPGLDSAYERCDNVDSQWSSWSSWSLCSASCGTGQEMRSRICIDPTPNSCNDDMYCQGDASDMRVCDRGPCTTKATAFCVDGNWGSWARWSSCSVSCGQGVRSRVRNCDNPPKNSCGWECPGDGFETEGCAEQACHTCVDGNWASWGSWSACSVSCDPGITSRSRTCSRPAPDHCGEQCEGRSNERKWCYNDPCVKPTAAPIRQCTDGNWGTWARWSSCSATCGAGVRERRRSCDRPTPDSCGRTCPGAPFERDVCQSNVPCQQCVDGNWGTWARWSTCSATCGDGVMERRRRCDRPTPNDCGRTCPGSASERDVCKSNVACPAQCVDGNWGTWARWSTCSATCGNGVMERRRRCDRPTPNDCGRTCPGSAYERDICKSNVACTSQCVDGNWGTWARWSTCSATCGAGVRERRRRCDRPAANACGRTCPGSDSQRDGCQNNVACPTQTCIDGGYSSWIEWGACSVTCGRGQRSYIRTCDSPVPNSCGKRCEGPDEKVEECQDRPCTSGPFNLRDEPVWTTWGAWEKCNCRTGRRSRTRQCAYRSSSTRVDNRRCQGPAENTEMCDVRLDCPECIESCNALANGLYPSCASCKQYIQCLGGQEDREECRSGMEWDAYKNKCVVAPSPSCSIVDCVDDCRNKNSGLYQSCGRCNAYVKCSNGRLQLKQCSNPKAEFNQHTQRCEKKRSPTCPRYYLAPYTSSRDYKRFRMNDAPAPVQVEPKEGGETKNENEATFKSAPTIKIIEAIKGVAGCVSDCKGVKAGRYPSCTGCNHFVVCTRKGILKERLCNRKKQWDDRKKRCMYISSTCVGK